MAASGTNSARIDGEANFSTLSSLISVLASIINARREAQVSIYKPSSKQAAPSSTDYTKLP